MEAAAALNSPCAYQASVEVVDRSPLVVVSLVCSLISACGILITLCVCWRRARRGTKSFNVGDYPGLLAAADAAHVGLSVGEGGIVWTNTGEPVLGPGGPFCIADKRVPPLATIGAGGAVFDAHGKPVLDSDSKPLTAADAALWWVGALPPGSTGTNDAGTAAGHVCSRRRQRPPAEVGGGGGAEEAAARLRGSASREHEAETPRADEPPAAFAKPFYAEVDVPHAPGGFRVRV
jgi:hypothetical protein